MNPKVGMAVWFWEHGDRQRTAGEQPRAGTIAFVHDPTTLNIGYLNSSGVSANATSLRFWNGQGARPTGPYCEWPLQAEGRSAREEQEAPAEALGAG